MAVVTSAMFRTWPVRLPAIAVDAVGEVLPDARRRPRTRLAAEHALRAHLAGDAGDLGGEALSWSTIVLMVFLSSRISPLTSTVIFFDRSPLATAVVTSAMLRTWPVRLPAMLLTLSVRSFQTPATPWTWAWPPRRPSEPTSRATRVTSEAKQSSWSTIVLMVFLSSRISPLTSTVIFLERSPLATAVVTSAMLRTWPVRLPAILLTLSVRSFQTPATPRTCGLAAELALGADLAGDAGDFGGEAS